MNYVLFAASKDEYLIDLASGDLSFCISALVKEVENSALDEVHALVIEENIPVYGGIVLEHILQSDPNTTCNREERTDAID